MCYYFVLWLTADSNMYLNFKLLFCNAKMANYDVSLRASVICLCSVQWCQLCSVQDDVSKVDYNRLLQLFLSVKPLYAIIIL